MTTLCKWFQFQPYKLVFKIYLEGISEAALSPMSTTERHNEIMCLFWGQQKQVLNPYSSFALTCV